MDDDADAASAAPDSTSSGLQLVEGVEVSFVALMIRILLDMQQNIINNLASLESIYTSINHYEQVAYERPAATASKEDVPDASGDDSGGGESLEELMKKMKGL